MRLIDCKACGKKITTQASPCPNCGAPVKKKQRSSLSHPKLIFLAVAIELVIGFFGKPTNNSHMGNQGEETPNAAMPERTNRLLPVKIKEGSTSYVAARE